MGLYLPTLLLTYLDGQLIIIKKLLVTYVKGLKFQICLAVGFASFKLFSIRALPFYFYSLKSVSEI